jgi:purine-binding chemotaxis protein CheW
MSDQSAPQAGMLAHAPQLYPGAGGTEESGADAAQFITFAIGDDHYGIDITAVREIKDWAAIRHLPHQPDYMRGICNLRGAYIPIIDLRCRFGLGLTKATPLHVFIIVQIGDRQIGLLADRVSDIVTVDRADIKPVPEVAETKGSGFLSGLVNVEDATVGLLDLDRILEADAQAAGETAAEPAMLDA